MHVYMSTEGGGGHNLNYTDELGGGPNTQYIQPPTPPSAVEAAPETQRLE